MLSRIKIKYSEICYRRMLPGHRYLLTHIADTATNKPTDTVVPPRDARVVVCGAGVMGASVAYHLGKLGWGAETVLIEQNRWIPESCCSDYNIVLCCWQDRGRHDLALIRTDRRVQTEPVPSETDQIQRGSVQGAGIQGLVHRLEAVW